MKTHSSSDPSWLPHVAAKRYSTGSVVLELVATFSTEKSLWTNDHARQPNASATNTNWPCAAGRAIAISRVLPRAAPTSGRMPCTSAMQSAITSAK